MDEDLDAKSQWPDPWLSLNPCFADGGSVGDLVADGYLYETCADLPESGHGRPPRAHERRCAKMFPQSPVPAPIPARLMHTLSLVRNLDGGRPAVLFRKPRATVEMINDLNG
jgi:hypothetical protein